VHAPTNQPDFVSLARIPSAPTCMCARAPPTHAQPGVSVRWLTVTTPKPYPTYALASTNFTLRLTDLWSFPISRSCLLLARKLPLLAMTFYVRTLAFRFKCEWSRKELLRHRCLIPPLPRPRPPTHSHH
jgi:hypothetical protein